jgi:hypothetical protein
MLEEAKVKNLPSGGKRGGLLIDEMTLQGDLLCKRSEDEFIVVGALDIGDEGRNIDTLIRKKKQCRMGTHALQFHFHGFTGFRWPVAFFVTDTAPAYQLHLLMWEAVYTLDQYEFTVDYVSLDGASTNRSLTKMQFQGDPRDYSFTFQDVYDPTHQITFIQDVKHTIKKIRNGLFARVLKLDGHDVNWSHWRSAFAFNKMDGMRLHKKLTNSHIDLTTNDKMRNKYAMDVLDGKMLYLMQEYNKSTDCTQDLTGTLALLEKTSVLVNIVMDINNAITSADDPRLSQLMDVLDFFNKWESESTPKSCKLTEQTREDINSSILGFVNLCKKLEKLGISIIPGFINSDLVENFFCQQRGKCNGNTTNPTAIQYGPAVNAIILGESTISKKSNTSTGQRRKAKPLSHHLPCPLKNIRV